MPTHRKHFVTISCYFCDGGGADLGLHPMNKEAVTKECWIGEPHHHSGAWGRLIRW